MFFPTIDDTGSVLLDAFEQRLHIDPEADLTDFLPAADSPHHLAVATELARIDMEYAWGRGAPRRPHPAVALARAGRRCRMTNRPDGE